ncbi:MAG TPA: 2-oxoacid:acceptor oxidoreductase family protein [Thermodesulfobacteriota bacterium]|nr:2-oxoacid:acceptor oxidoreductase family protein [Thermodesulfobacteriota bacterium]
MIEIRIHGRGGQGAVVASKMLVTAAAKEGKKVQAFPFFGAERRGAAVAAFARIDDRKIRIHSEVYTPDQVIVLDPVLHKAVPVTAGLKKGGKILLNSPQEPSEFPFPPDFDVATVDASGIARRHKLGSRTEPIVNTAMLGAYAKISGIVGIEALAETIRESIPGKGKENEAAAREAYEKVRIRKA